MKENYTPSKKVFIEFASCIIAAFACVTPSLAQWTNNGNSINNSNTGRVGINTGAINLNDSALDPDLKLSVFPNGKGGIFIGHPNTATGGYTSLLLRISALQGGYSSIQSIKSSGSLLGVLALNDGGGNVGIGTTAPGSYKLAVAGKIAAWDEIKVFTNGSSFPDYVFAPEYKLRTLEETEKYVKENHHLPEVPSAADIAKDGMSLNGMNEILLKKVEELTLYMIEMKKENDILKKRVVVLEKNK